MQARCSNRGAARDDFRFLPVSDLRGIEARPDQRSERRRQICVAVAKGTLGLMIGLALSFSVCYG